MYHLEFQSSNIKFQVVFTCCLFHTVLPTKRNRPDYTNSPERGHKEGNQ